ncbi:MAG TPA: MFS transporter [Nitrososphaeraceae archaeon]|jgi:MFS transporter, DHA1 family, tetracycline resistance protein|nr:MFS transporter [Nitrososphaeraceae archaeon]
MASSINKQIPLYPLLLINFIGTLGFSIVLPFLVFLVIDFGGNAIIYGILAAVYPAFQLIGAPILGRWSDIYGRKKVLLVSNGGTLIGWIFFLFALFLPVENLFSIDSSLFGTFAITLPLLVLFFARAIDGITGGNISVANAYLADISSDENRSKNFGKMAVSSNLGFIVGPALAGILGATIYQEILPVLAALFLSLLTLIVIGFALKESKPQLVVVTEQIPEKESIRKVFAQECKECYQVPNPKKLRFKDVFKLKHISFLLVLYFFIFLGFNIFYTSFPIHVVNSLKWSITELGVFYAVLSGIMVLVQGPVLRKALKKFSEEKLVIIGSIILGTNFILFVSNNNIFIYGAAVLFAVGNGLMWPSFLSLLSKIAGNAYQGFIQGVASSFGSLASIVGLIIGGLLYNLIGGFTFLISAGIIFVVFIMSFKLLKL